MKQIFPAGSITSSNIIDIYTVYIYNIYIHMKEILDIYQIATWHSYNRKQHQEWSG